MRATYFWALSALLIGGAAGQRAREGGFGVSRSPPGGGGLRANVLETRRLHHTEDFEHPGIVVRRGSEVRFGGLSDPLISLTPVRAGEGTSRAAQIAPSFTLSSETGHRGWSVARQSGSVVLRVPVDAQVGRYLIRAGGDVDELIVLLNAWDPEDTVYVPDESERREYILSDVGRMWVGSARSHVARAWSFAQFKTASLHASLSLLDRMSWEDRNDPVKIARHLGAAVNSKDDGGVIIGRWDGRYESGTSPLAWTGSGEILEQFWRTGRSVGFGQCWVFAGVLASVMRSLGFAVYPVTNFSSGHDSDDPFNLQINYYFDHNGNYLPRLSDTIWNHHVWVEVLMRRPDLGPAETVGGVFTDPVQVLDATPQERSPTRGQTGPGGRRSGPFRLGPVPRENVKERLAYHPDVDFVFGEVNGDIVSHMATDAGMSRYDVVRVDTDGVGLLILGKAVGSNAPQDLTLNYKYPEGSRGERRPFRGGVLAKRSLEDGKSAPGVSGGRGRGSITFTPETPEDIKTGQRGAASVVASNVGETDQQVLVHFDVNVMSYDGQVLGPIGSRNVTFDLSSGEAEKTSVEIIPDDVDRYLHHGFIYVQFVMTGRVVGTPQVWLSSATVRVDSSGLLQVIAPEAVAVGESATVEVTVHNPTSLPWTKGRLRVECTGSAEISVSDLGEDIQPNSTVVVTRAIGTKEEGSRELIFTLDTAEMRDLVASHHIIVGGSKARPTESHPSSCKRRV